MANAGEHAPGPADAARVAALRECGLSLAREGKLDKALEEFEEARRLCRDIDDEPLLSDIYAELGDVQAERHEMQAAIDAYKRALELDQEHRDHRGQAHVLCGLGMAYTEQGEWSRADDALSDADRQLERVSAQPVDADRARLHCARGRLLMEQARYRDAADRFEIALDIAKRLNELTLELLALRHLAGALHEIGRSAEAVARLQRAEEILAMPGEEDIPERIEVQNLHGSILEDDNRTTDALKLYRSSLRDAEDLNLAPAQAEAHRRIASAYAVQGDLTRSCQHYEQAIEICVKLKDAPALSQLYGDLGDVMLEAGKTDDAIILFKDALRLDSDHKDILGKALAHRRLGAAYQARGQLREAKDDYDEAEALLKSTDDEGELAVVCNHLGSLLLEQGHPQKARERFERALEINRQQGNGTGEAISLRWLGAALRELDDLDEAERSLTAAAEILEERQGGEDRPELIEVQVGRAEILDERGRTSEALKCLVDALRLARQLDNAPLIMRVLGRTGAAHADAGEMGRAIERFREAIAIAESLHDEPECSELYGSLGDVLAELGRHDEAIDYYRNALELDQEHQDVLGRATGYRRLAASYQARGEFSQAEQALKSAASALSRAEDRAEEALLRRQEGNLLHEEGHFRAALALYEDALDGADSLDAAVTLRLMADTDLALGELDNAERHLQQARDHLQRTGDEDAPECVAQLVLDARIKLERHDPHKALALVEQAYVHAGNLEIPPLTITALTGRARIQCELGRYPAAIESLRAAIGQASEKDNLLLARLEDDLGDVNLAAGRSEDARGHYTTARKKIAKLDQPALLADILLGLARCHRQLGQLDSVRGLLNEAKEAIGELESSNVIQARLSLELAQLDELDGQHEAAIENYENALEVFARSQDTARALECHELLLRAHARQGQLGEASVHLAEALGPERLAELWAAVLPRMHPEIADAAHAGYEKKNYEAAVREAFKACEDALRERTRDDGKSPLVTQINAWFGSPEEGQSAKRGKGSDSAAVEIAEPLRPGLQPWTRRTHQVGMGQFWTGAFRSMRNPLTHESLRLNPTDAFAWLWVAHLMRTLLDPSEGRAEMAVDEDW